MGNDPSQDQDFLTAAPHEQHAYLMATDADYAKASPQDQVAYLSHVSPKLSQTQFEKDRPGKGISLEGSGRAALDATKGFLGNMWEGAKKSFSVDTDFSPEHAAEQIHGMDAEGQQRQQQDEARKKAGYGWLYRAAAQAPAPVNAASMEKHAERGEGGAILGEAGAGIGATIAPSAIRVGRSAIGASKALESVPTRSIGDVIEAPSKAPAYGLRKVFPEPAERVTAREGAATAEALEKQMTEVETARQKELADAEQLKQQDAESRMKRGREQTRLDTAHERRLSAAEAERQKELAANERLKTMHGNDLMRRDAEPPLPFAGASSTAPESVGAPIGLPTPKEQAPFPMVQSASQEAESVGTKIYPEPRDPLPGDRPGAMWTIPRKELPSAARGGVPGAGDVMRNLNHPIVYVPREGVGYAPPGEFEASQGRMQPPLGTPMPPAAEPAGLKPGLMSDIPQQAINPQELEEASRQAGRPISEAEFPEWRRQAEAERNIEQGLKGNRKDTAGEIREKHRAKLEKKGTR